jgi:pimeloyl-ACP methyl ester carboxylesterase
LTAIVDFTSVKGKQIARLRLINPSEVDKVDLGGTEYPVAADFSAPLASYGRINETWIGFLQMIRGERMRVRAGLLMATPYDPNRVPVVFVHGLLSSPFAWRNLVNSLMLDTADSESIVPTGHGAMSSPKTVAEIRRILLLELGSHARRRSVCAVSSVRVD